MDSNSIYKRIDTAFSGLMLVILMILILVMSENARGQSIHYEVIDPSCADCSDGVIDFTINYSLVDAEFTWSDGSSFEDMAGIGAGTYNVQIRDIGTGELYFYSIDLNHKTDPVVEIHTEPVTCNGYTNGVVSISARNTQGDILLSVNGSAPQKQTIAKGLGGGYHLVRVYDETGMIEERMITIHEPEPIRISTSVAYLSCLTNSAQIDAEISGGTGRYNTMWSDGLSGSSRYHTSPGEYHLTVTDENFCVATDHVSIPYHSGNMRVRSTSVGESEPGRSDGIIDIEINGGAKPLSFFWSNGYRGEDLYFVSSGVYSVRVKDGEGCEVVIPVEVPEASVQPVATGVSN
jgi:hypothetical protein